MKKFKLKETSYSFDRKGMIIEGECGNGIVKALAKDLCKTNENIMTKEKIMDCMSNGAYYKWNYYMNRLEPLETFKMTRLDYEMLKFVQKQGAKYICRDKKGLLNLFENEPYIISEGDSWYAKGKCEYFDNFTQQLFQFVKWEDKKYYVIKDVLNNCEVVEDVGE
nr:MAG TPA: hypothetical protein [Caudoviricetes sp.]